MRFIFIPNTLKLLSLLEWNAPQLGDALRYIAEQIQQRQYEPALKFITSAISSKMVARDRYAAALLLLYKANIEYAYQHWETVLADTQRALTWIKMQPTQISRYNQAIAHYWEGITHYLLQSDEHAIQAFALADKLLEESERHWGFENNVLRVADCQNLSRWMRNLTDLHHRLTDTSLVFIMPLYEPVNRTLARIGAIAVTPHLMMLPKHTLAQTLNPNYIPLEMNALPFLYLQPDSNYIALRALDNEFMSPQTQVDNLLIVEVFPISDPETIDNTTTPFKRRTDGYVHFPKRQKITEELHGTARFLIRGENEPWIIVSVTATSAGE